MLEIGLAILLAAFIGGTVKGWVSLHRRRRARLRFYRTQFFESANRMIEDETVDDATLLRIKAMVSDIDESETFRALMKALAEIDKQIRKGILVPPPKHETPPGWGVLAFCYFLAVSYSRPIRGGILRDLLVHILDPRSEDRNTDIIDRHIHKPTFQPA